MLRKSVAGSPSSYKMSIPRQCATFYPLLPHPHGYNPLTLREVFQKAGPRV